MSVVENNIIYTDDLKTVLGCSGYVREAVIKEGVKTILPAAFDSHRELESVKFPKSLRTIGKSAFEGCIRLQEAILPDGVNCVGEGAFMRCNALSKVKLPYRLEKIEASVFEGCAFLRDIEFSDCISEIGDKAFKGCEKLESVTIPDDVTYIGISAFENCVSLKDINLNDGLQIIEESTFSHVAVESITIPESVILIGNYAFAKCVDLKEVKWQTEMMPNDKKIGLIFSGCDNLNKVTRNGEMINFSKFSKKIDEIIEDNKQIEYSDEDLELMEEMQKLLESQDTSER